MYEAEFIMKRYFLFSLIFLLGLSLNSFCMEKKKLSKKEDTTRGYVVFKGLLYAYSKINDPESQKLKIASKNICDICFKFTKDKKSQFGKLGKWSIGLILDIDKASDNQWFFEERIFKILTIKKKEFSTILTKSDMEDKEDHSFLFEEDLTEVSEQETKDTLLLGAFIAKESKEDFTAMMKNALCYFNYEWVRKLLHWTIVSNIDYIELEINRLINGKLVIKRKINNNLDRE